MAMELLDEVLDNEIVSAKSTPDTALEIVRWWEWKRRLIYNAIVAVAGLPTVFIGVLYFDAFMMAGGELILSALFWALAANAFYCLGWVIELLLMVYFKYSTGLGRLRIVVYIIGIVGSVFVTLLPALGISAAIAFSGL